MTTISLDSIDEDLSAALMQGLAAVEDRLAAAVATSDAMMRWTAPYLLEAGGKRVRPALVFLAAAFGDPRRTEVVEAASLVELTHLATLYHDDVMDSAETRRGTVTAHKVWGNNAAILTGDFLFARASSMSSQLGPAVVRLHAETFERLCLGQLNETVGPSETDDPFDHYLSVLSNKTGSLLAAAGELGARMGQAPDDVAATMAKYGEAVGIAFQLADDVIDLRGDVKESGKTQGTDLREGVPTMPTLLLRKLVNSGEADDADSRLLAAIDSDLSNDDDLAAVVKTLAQHRVVDETQQLADRYGDEALALVESLPDTPARNALREFTRALVRRTA